ncbi:MAG TPA: homoserine dehydrogenase [Castellaniella sp.]|uniref:homoserine dehydrogenase n=1 Tax=Castellaniella sp. TaxID=1955812 RepID=UPI002EFDD97E
MSLDSKSAPLRIGIAGLGTVGQGVLRVLARNAEWIERRCGRRLVVTHACVRDRSKKRDCDLAGVVLLDDPLQLAQADVDVVIELIGGLDTAQALVLEALQAGKAVVSANKALLAERGQTVFAAAEATGCALGFEAAVGGGIPVIQALREGLASNRINTVAGIINGTSNYILTEMDHKGMAFDEALADAQRLGYAEADPSFDVDGIDAAHKLAILAAIAFGMPPAFTSVHTEGLDTVQAQDVRLAQELGYRIKPLAIAKCSEAGVELRVHPTLIPASHLLASVDGSLNAFRIHGDAAGQTVLIGAGAGAEPTASAVIGDLIEIARARTPSLPLGQAAAQLRPRRIVPLGEVESAYYLRLRVKDTPGVLRAITSIVADLDISIEAILQKEPRDHADATLAIITSITTESHCDQALARMMELSFMQPDATRLRVEYFND